MSSMNLTVSGRLGNNPIIRQGASGTQWVRFSLATSSSYRDQEGKWKDSETTWFNCKAWGNFAVNIAQSLRKGDPVVAQGRLVVGSYEHSDQSTGVVSERADIALHLTHIGIDLVHTSTVNVRHAGANKVTEKSGFDVEPEQTTNLDSSEATEVPDELVDEINEVEESSLVQAGTSEAPF
ncbi:single-stranded DNA-binding protein [Mobiluncus mulieris]|uniref:Single-stranded DNA-binding protein n=1 Tax=Mobiluncus mulieris TaxID=2052 RepID=A0ABD4TX59_9ACTO|nr:single-stranded DNA-binding protein [Mobiluncus mulieris]MCU9969470.1 single-stranded DNA-binding protein [Mobiluncus mulieris]MCU9973909.1 single-stranded DNA-binding protein [Mobiluncus mulieris]MCV0009908.1 single-stranded DNA-binding protein [Mobiluncus mulieris]NMW75620.1 single-stranded DNA-binding protein [Mobiluncus mulieris]NMX01729.1 single-stranded DNA-binding protein [Mobiluncus mulieris]